MTDRDDAAIEWLDAAPVEYLDHRPSDRPPTKRVVLIAAAVAVLVGVLLVVKLAGKSSPSTHAAARSSASSAASYTRSPAQPPVLLPTDIPVATSATPVTVTEVGHPVFGITGRWTLYGLGPNLLVRVELSNGRITTTPLPNLGTDGPVTLLANQGGAIVHPWDAEASYFVPDGQPATQLPGEFNHGGASFLGPDASHVWVQSGDLNSTTLTLLDLTGHANGVSIAAPANAAVPNVSDDTGGVVYDGAGGFYDAQPTGLRRITTGAVLAVGPTKWLTAECDDRALCTITAIDRSSGAHLSLGQPTSDVNAPIGAISPDGRQAAVFHADATGQLSLALVDLRTGARFPLAVPISNNQVYAGSVLAWSPDSKWLFVLDQSGTVRAVNAQSRSEQDLGITLPILNQLTLRATG